MSLIELQKQRLAAAEFSRGISNHAVYNTFEQIISTRPIRGDVLDLGAGTGTLTQRLIKLGGFKSINAADLLPRPLQIPSEVQWIQSDLNQKFLIDDTSFDAIFCAEVIEHLENPRAFLRECYRVLRKPGVLVLSTPNNESYRSLLSLLFRGNFVDFLDSNYPAHITPILRLDLTRMLTECGFRSSKFYFTNRGALPKLTSLTWQTLSNGLLRGLRFSDNLLVVAEK